MKDFIITGARLILPDAISEGNDVLVRDGKIAEIGPGLGGADSERVHAKGAYLSPGLVDEHIHGAFGIMCQSARVEDLQRMSEALPGLGTTSFLPTVESSRMEETLTALSTIRQARETLTGARILGIHMEGPYLNPARAGAQRFDALRKYEKGDLKRYIEASEGFLTMMGLAPELDGGMDLIGELSREGIIPGAVHTDATFAEGTQAIERGLRVTCHTFNAMRPIHHREPGIAVAALLSGEVYSEFICDGFHLAAPMVEMGYRLKGPDRMIMVSDAVAVLGLPEGEYDFFGAKVRLVEGRIFIAGSGVLAGSASPLMKGVRNVYNNTDIPLVHIVRAASLNPATLIGVDDRVGSIAVGKEADLLLLDGKLDILKTWVGGREIA